MEYPQSPGKARHALEYIIINLRQMNRLGAANNVQALRMKVFGASLVLTEWKVLCEAWQRVEEIYADSNELDCAQARIFHSDALLSYLHSLNAVNSDKTLVQIQLQHVEQLLQQPPFSHHYPQPIIPFQRMLYQDQCRPKWGSTSITERVEQSLELADQAKLSNANIRELLWLLWGWNELVKALPGSYPFLVTPTWVTKSSIE